MPDYTKGKIYSIRSHKTDLIYIGSTIQPLSVRIGGHRNDYNNHYLKNGEYRCRTIEIFKLDPNPYIELIKNFSCDSKDELRKEEGKYIRKMKCVNKKVDGRTKKEYREDNKENIKEYKKKYYEDNKEIIKEQSKQHYEKNKEQKKEQKKGYYNNNKEKINEKNKEYRNKIIKCPSCNLEMKNCNLNYHKKNKCKKLNIE